MRLERVVFSKQVRLKGQMLSEVTAAMFPGDVIELDKDAQSVCIGNTCIPLSSVVSYDLAARGWPCDVPGCGYAASDPRGLGAHKKGAHNIGGTSPGRSGAK